MMQAMSCAMPPSQEVIDSWHADNHPDFRTPDRLALKFSEESGEVVRAVVRILEGRGSLDDLSTEFGDVLITLSILAEHFGLDLAHVLAKRWPEVRDR